MRYRSRPVEVEAMQWTKRDPNYHGASERAEKEAQQIVAWINANGGEAFYDAPVPLGHRGVQPASIALRTKDGTKFAAPGDFIVMNSEVVDYRIDNDSGLDLPVVKRAFSVCDPETFEKRWEPAGSSVPEQPATERTQGEAAKAEVEIERDARGLEIDALRREIINTYGDDQFNGGVWLGHYDTRRGYARMDERAALAAKYGVEK